MIDYLHSDAARGGFLKWTGGIAVQCLPSILVDFGFQRGFQCFVRVVGSQEVGVAYEEAFFVVVGVNKPASDAIYAIALYLATAGVEHVDAIDLDLVLLVFRFRDVYVRFAEDDEQVALAGVLKVFGHMQVGVHPGFEHRYATQFLKLRRVGVVVEGAGDEYVETSITGFQPGRHSPGRDGAQCRTPGR